MKRFRALLLAVLWGLLALGWQPALAAGQAAGAARLASASHVEMFQPTECWFAVPASLHVQCGWLEVPEDRARPGGRTIHLAVAILKSSAPHPQPDPLVFLQGGPGGGAVGGIPTGGAAFFAPILLHRDVILFDQRGTGFSQPALDCPQQEMAFEQFVGQDLTFEQTVPQALQMIKDCRQALVEQGINLSAYNTTYSAADVEDLRLALSNLYGYDKINLYGLSYGTRLALTVLRDHPQGLRSIILNSPFPPQVNSYNDGVENANRAFETLFQGCQADLFCRLAYPDLREVFYATVDRLDAEPVTLHVTHPKTGQPAAFTITGNQVTGVIFNQLYNTGALGRLPAMIYDVRDGDYDAIVAQLWAAGDTFSGFSTGMALSVMCREEASSAGQAPEASEAYPAALRSQVDHSMLSGALGLEICRAWDVPAAPASEKQPATGSVPTLVLTGQYDPVTPPEYGRLAAQTLENGYFFEFPGVGHGVMAGGNCPLGIALSFLNDPSHPPGGNCVAAMKAPAFTLRSRLARPWVGIACLILLGVFGWLGYRYGRDIWQRRGWLDWRGRRSLNLLLAGASAGLIALLLFINTTNPDFGNAPMLLTGRVVETVVPMILAIQFAVAFSPEDEPGLEVLLACPRPPAWVLLERLGPPLALQGIMALVGGLAAWWMGGGSLLTALLRWIPPALFMGGLALYMTLTTRRSAFSLAMSVLMWWAMTLLGTGLIKRWPVLWALDVYLQPEELSNVEYILNRLFIALLGVGLALLAARQLQNEEHTLLGGASQRSRR